MTREEMREKVLAVVNKWPHTPSGAIADAVIDFIRGETLEEAARVCESELVEPSDRWMSGYSDACKENAAAIRALGKA